MNNLINSPENRFMEAIRKGETQLGLWLALTSNIAAEVIGAVGYDWLVLDAEHAPNDLNTLIPQLQALRGSMSEPVVRATWNDPVLIKRFMDIGFRTILFPYVQDEKEAEAAVAAMRYPPEGVPRCCHHASVMFLRCRGRLYPVGKRPSLCIGAGGNGRRGRAYRANL